MLRPLLRDDQWDRIKGLLPGKRGDPGATAGDNRLFVEAVLWIGRTGAPWRDLPKAFGKWYSVYTRFYRLTKKGVWKQIAESLCGEADLEEFIPDSTVVRFPPARCGCAKKNGPQAVGRSRGGLTTKVHAATDALGNPVRWLLTPGQESDISQAPALLEGFSPERVIADKGYDADSFIDKIRSLGAEPVIPPRSNRVEQREYDRHWYKNRNLVERFFNRIKQFRRIATRYEKLDRNFMAMIDIACICIWLL